MVRVTATALLLVASGCGGASEEAPLRIFAAASLTEAFGELEQSFERHHAGLDVLGASLLHDAAHARTRQLGTSQTLTLLELLCSFGSCSVLHVDVVAVRLTD